MGIVTAMLVVVWMQSIWMERSEGTRLRRGPWPVLLTVSSLPASILSVVAAMLPPFLWRSQSAVRRSTCGNICCILSTAASRCRRAEVESRVGFCPAAGAEKKK